MHPVVLFISVAAILHIFLSIVIQVFQRSRLRQKLSKSRGCKPGRQEQKWDILGIQKIVRATRAVLSGGILGYTDEIFATHGDTYASSFLGVKVIFTCDSSNLKQILVSRWLDYDASKHLRIRMWKYVAPGTIAAVDGPVWKGLRTFWRLQFAAANNMFDIESQEHHFQKLIGLIPTDQTVDMQPLVCDLMTDLMTHNALGFSIGAMEQEKSGDAKRLTESLYYVIEKMAKDGFLGPAAILLGKKKQLEATAYLHSFVDSVILKKVEQQRAGDLVSGKLCVLDNLIKQTTDLVELRDLVLTLLIGANQTVGALLFTAIWTLSKHPRVFEKLRTSILETVGYDAPSVQQLKSLVYLNHVLHEVLRLYPPLPFNARIANKDTWLGTGGGEDGTDPLLVKSGQCIVFSIWGSHRNPKYFGDDALQFRPERWNTLSVDTPGYLPFLMGPRVCLGQNFAMSETCYIIVRLLQTYKKIESRDDDDFKPDLRLFLAHKDGVLVSFTKDPQSQLKV